jgi:mannose-6-phosphate isomerase-like protein (cupin superfamily)
VALLAEVDEIAVTEIRAEPGAARRSSQRDGRVASFYVLEGEVSLAIGDREQQAEAGSWVQVPPRVPHTIAGTGRGPARFLELRT